MTPMQVTEDVLYTYKQLGFEEVFTSQLPVTEPWEAVTDYSWKAREEIERPNADRIVEVFGKGPYLDYGCGPDAILVRLLRDRGVMVHGIDPILKAQWECLQPHWDNGPEQFVGTFPVIICREVFEHVPLRNILPTIQSWERFAPQFVYITTRFSSEHDIWTVETSDTLDPTHITIASKDFYRMLLVLCGYKRRADLEERMDHMGKGRVLVYETTKKYWRDRV